MNNYNEEANEVQALTMEEITVTQDREMLVYLKRKLIETLEMKGIQNKEYIQEFLDVTNERIKQITH